MKVGQVVVAPGFLQNPEVRRWLNWIEPAWTTLEVNSYNALHHEPSASNHAIRLDPNLTETDLSGSAVARNALLVLRHAIETGGLKLTQTGNLSRSVVAEMVEIVEWPGFHKTEAFRLHKVINEPDFLPLYFVRVLVKAAKLLRARRGKLVATRLGEDIVSKEQHGALQAVLFHLAFWHLNLGFFDGIQIESWPQSHVGVVLWSLSASADDWLDRETLTRLCTVPIAGLLEADWDIGSYAMEARILRPLLWFGLLEQRSEKGASPVNRHLYRKTRLFAALRPTRECSGTRR